MLNLSYLGIAFAVVFYVVFGITVRLMQLDKVQRNKARLAIVVTTLSIIFISSLFAGLLNLNTGKYLFGVLFILMSAASLIILLSILVELHHIRTKVKIRRFMVIFDIVDTFINEGKSREEIMYYLIEIQKLTKREAQNFMEFISDPQNYEFLVDVNEEIRSARALGARK